MGAIKAEEIKCQICDGDHQASRCINEQNMTRDQIAARVRKHNLCYSCLKPTDGYGESNHNSKTCTWQCPICKDNHHIILHPDFQASRPKTPSPQRPPQSRRPPSPYSQKRNTNDRPPQYQEQRNYRNNSPYYRDNNYSRARILHLPTPRRNTSTTNEIQTFCTK